jgi:catecholate siderophore receptor
MEFRAEGTLKDRARLARFNLSFRASVLALSAAAAFMFCPGGFARAQEANGEAGTEKINGAAPATKSNDQADGAPPSQGEVPEVLVEQQPETKPAPVVTPKPKPRPVTRQPVAPPPPPQQPTIEAYDAEQKEIQSIIFDLPVDGDTLNRGTSGVDGYFAAGTSAATKTNTLIMNIPGSVSIITEEMAEDQAVNTLGQALLYVPGITVQQGEGHRDQLTFRGQRTTADFFVDGVRDDIETFRDLYNAQTVEVLKRPLAMIFGRGAAAA